MRLPFGFELRRRAKAQSLTTVDGIDRGWQVIFESRPGAWQSDVVVNEDHVLAQATVFACMTLIAGDVSKLEIELTQEKAGIRVEAPKLHPVAALLRRPNKYQTPQQFLESWVLSKLSRGNTYALKERDRAGQVVALHVMDTTRTTPLVSEDGSVFYRFNDDDLAGVDRQTVVPASEVIHDRWNCLHHPLVGLSPIFACGLAATTGLKIGQNAANFFANMSRPSGVITAPGRISDANAARIKDEWTKNFGADRIGSVAVLGDSLAYAPMTMSAVDAQLVETLKLTAEQICSVFHVPPFMVGVGASPAYNNVEALGQQYYSQCLQTLLEAIENCLDDGLGLGGTELAIEFDLDDLLRMDSATMTTALRDQVGAGIASPNEARRRFNLPPVTGGETPYLQQQNYSLAALAKRDQAEDPFGTSSDTPAAAVADGVRAMREALAEQASVIFDGMTDTSARMLQAVDQVRARVQRDAEDELEAQALAAAIVARFSEGATDAA
jgi:HK97 family phage portal protein